MKKILVVDDEEDLRNIVMDVLKIHGFDAAGAADGFSAIEMIKKEPPDAVILDLNMPGMNGIETLREIKKIRPGLPVVILTGNGDISMVVKAIKLGASDFIKKPFVFENLIAILREAVEISGKNCLSEREKETLTWVKEGKSNIEIAMIMKVSENTVRTYLKRIFGKLGASSKVQAVSSAFEKSLF